jgi:hypothetical protein
MAGNVCGTLDTRQQRHEKFGLMVHSCANLTDYCIILHMK